MSLSGTWSYVLPCSTKTEVVPEKYKSAIASAHSGYQRGSSSRRGRSDVPASAATNRLPSKIRFEYGGSFSKLVGQPGEMLQLIHRFFGLLHTLGRCRDLM